MPRILELVLVILSLPVWGVMLIAVALVIACTGAPVFFRQERPGLHEHPFLMLKFCTMRPGDAPDDERITRLGRFLRATSLDELPELINVLRGEMALVGPRPLLMRYLPLYNETQHHRHDVRPGITGWAQVNGRNALSWPQKFAYDLEYIQKRSTALDVKIILMTLGKVLKREGIPCPGPFLGNEEERSS